MMHSKERSATKRETLQRHRTIQLNEGKNAIGADTFCELLSSKTVLMKKAKMIEACSDRSSAITMIACADEPHKLYACDESPDKPPKSSTKKRSCYIQGCIMELLIAGGVLEERQGRKLKDVDLHKLLDDLKKRLQEKPNKADTNDDEITQAEKAADCRKEMIAAFIEGVTPTKDAESSTAEASSSRDNSAGVDDAQMSSTKSAPASSMLNVSGLKKILLDNKKTHIGASHQERMTMGPKKMGPVSPFEVGKELVKKDNVKEKRERKKEEHEHKCKLAEMHFISACRNEQALEQGGEIDPCPQVDKHEAIQERGDALSLWHSS